MDLATVFHFSVAFGAAGPQSAKQLSGWDCGFREVTGIGSEIELETVYEGGENRYALQLPKAVRGGRLTLKSGMMARTSQLTLWCRDILEGGLTRRIETRLLHVHLLNAEREPLRSWSFDHAFPVKWSVADLNATENKLAVESIELSYLTCKQGAS